MSALTPNAAYAQSTGNGDPVDTSRVQEMEQGNPDSAVTVIEFASFTCPHCAHFNQTVYRQLKEAYIDT
ncbi:MAG: thioredoxin domain-containing protein, partial [Rhodobacteraceae bacterium]|nr:thioredoxin domain-containing protein [Paracoccaceae bacterium]